MNRYTTNRYVTVCWTEVVRLADLDGTSLSNVMCDQNVALLHRTDWWAWWSDERLTTAIGLPDNLWPKRLSLDAAKLIFDVWSGGLSFPQCGWAVLAEVKSIASRETIRTNSLGNNSPISKWEKLTLLFEPDEPGLLYCHSYYDGEDYKCDIVSEPPQMTT